MAVVRAAKYGNVYVWRCKCRSQQENAGTVEKKLYKYENQPDMKEIIAVQDNEDNYKCPVCGQTFTGSDIIKHSYRCCYNCGQRVDFTLPRNRINRDL